MKTRDDLYERYTSTMALAGIDEKAEREMGDLYFKANFGKMLPDNKASSILDIGCGYGKYLNALAGMGYRNCFGIDISREQVDYARNVLGLSNVERADALEWLKGKDSVFNCILAIDILEHIELDYLLELGEKICTALKPGGMLIAQVPNAVSPLNPLIYGDLTHLRAFTVQSMRQFFLSAGLVPVKYAEVAPHVHNIRPDIRSTVHHALWSFFLKPLIHVVVFIAYGKEMANGIYSANFIAVAKRPG